MNHNDIYNNYSQIPDFRFKIIMIGNSVVGKTSLLSSYIDNNFQLSTVPTLGVDFKFKDIVIHNKIVQMQIWDTAGQDNFRSITKTYYKGADAVVIVYDITNPESFDSLKQYWINEILQHADEQVEVMVLANKIDQSPLRQVSIRDGERFAEQKNFLFKEVTATEPQLIHEAFETLVSKILPYRRPLRESQYNLSQKLQINPNKSISCWQKIKIFLGVF